MLDILNEWHQKADKKILSEYYENSVFKNIDFKERNEQSIPDWILFPALGVPCDQKIANTNFDILDEWCTYYIYDKNSEPKTNESVYDFLLFITTYCLAAHFDISGWFRICKMLRNLIASGKMGAASAILFVEEIRCAGQSMKITNLRSDELFCLELSARASYIATENEAVDRAVDIIIFQIVGD